MVLAEKKTILLKFQQWLPSSEYQMHVLPSYPQKP